MDQPLAPQQSPIPDQPAPFSDEKTPAATAAAAAAAAAAAKTPVVRGARACTVCRAAKMKCVGADDGNNVPCQRCKRSGAECIFEKHRRGRKPGSRLSEASKMLRRLEKGYNSAKQKSSVDESLTLPPLHDTRSGESSRPADPLSSSSRFSANDLPPLNLPPRMHSAYPHSSHQSDSEMDEADETDKADSGMYPARIIKQQNARNNSFFKTILNPADQEEPTATYSPGNSDRGYPRHTHSPPSFAAPQPQVSVARLFTSETPLKDPIEAGLIDEQTVAHLWDMFYIRLNPFINLFDPALHSVAYVRSRCPFLFTTLVMACCKFFKTELYLSMLRLAHDFAVRAFAENWRSAEVVQAFACMTYWKEPDDTRTWTYIGYACRMAVELGLNRYVGKRQPGETDVQMRERRNRERTYMVLFVHDRSLSMQHGKHWMLPEDDLVRHATTWHEEGSMPIRQEDVIVAAFTQLRSIAAETTDVFNMHQMGAAANAADVNYEMLLRNCNQKLNQWGQKWTHELQRARGEQFHFSILRFFQLHVRLFLNTFGINSPAQGPGHVNVQALNTCYTDAKENLQIMADDFARIQMLRYGQDSTTVMTAYSAVVLLKASNSFLSLLRGSNALSELKEGAAQEIHAMITKTAKAYQDAAHLSPASASAAYHARFLTSLVANDVQKMQQQAEQESLKREMPAQARYHSAPGHGALNGHSAHGYNHSMYGHSSGSGSGDHHGYYSSPSSGASGVQPPSVCGSSSTSSASPYAQTHSLGSYALVRDADHTMTDARPGSHSGAGNGALTNYSLSGISSTYVQYQAQPVAEHDAVYWRNMLNDLGFGESAEQAYGAPVYQTNGAVDATSAPVAVGSAGGGAPVYAGGAGVSYARSQPHVGEGVSVYEGQQQATPYTYPGVMGTYQPSAYSAR
ncbi:uncharacterized protein FIBRA_08791 [Fibroporia radiculosa]|uniref:Zn(2)-C6 fungal-type domain-containing protein n=1 Tax=Fibroporia radiculosa TaxID=599839 RepID=J4H5C9_9APHY|nr:uncharacterized protein FIBRA_08791 [Fibroporia radiculosa]CCM06519.1 predicted protein [Fibroporia radiculosa]